MKLGQRLANLEGADAQPGPDGGHDALDELKHRAQQALFATLGNVEARTNNDNLRRDVERHLDEILAREEHLLSDDERQEIVEAVTDDLLALGPIQGFLDDPTVTEVMVNGPDEVYIERAGHLERTDARFEDEEHIRSIIERIVAQVDRHIDDANPMVDARLADGSRVNAVLPPLTVRSPTLTIRKFAQVAIGMDELIAYGTISHDVRSFLQACVEAKCNILISGGTGSGKTTLMNALSSFIPDGERIITIEDTAELRLQQPHVVQMEARPANVEGAGTVTIRDLVRNSLRMRPDRIVVGETRGAEALDMLQAMNTGHEGSLTTLHANSGPAALSRLETMVLTAGVDLPHRAIRDQVVDAIDIVVQLARLADGSRRVVEISEVVGLENDAIAMRDIFLHDWTAGRSADGRFLGELRPTGVRPAIAGRLQNRGHPLPSRFFDFPPATATNPN